MTNFTIKKKPTFIVGGVRWRRRKRGASGGESPGHHRRQCVGRGDKYSSRGRVNRGWGGRRGRWICGAAIIDVVNVVGVVAISGVYGGGVWCCFVVVVVLVSAVVVVVIVVVVTSDAAESFDCDAFRRSRSAVILRGAAFPVLTCAPLRPFASDCPRRQRRMRVERIEV